MKTAFFEIFHSIDLLGAKEIILSFAKILSKNFVDPYNLFLDIFHVRYFIKNIGHKRLFTGKVAFFPKVCLVNNLLGATDVILLLPQ